MQKVIFLTIRKPKPSEAWLRDERLEKKRLGNCFGFITSLRTLLSTIKQSSRKSPSLLRRHPLL